MGIIRFLRSAFVSGVVLVILPLTALTIGCLVPGLTRHLDVASEPLPQVVSAEPQPQALQSSADSYRVMVMRSGRDTELVLPLLPLTRQRLGFLSASGMALDGSEAEWLVVGWGGRTATLDTPTTASAELASLLTSFMGDAAVLRVRTASGIDQRSPDVRAFDVGGQAFIAMLSFVDRSFARDPEGNSVPVAPAPTGDDLFYEGSRPYNALLGCNVWAADGLRLAGIAAGMWTPLPQTLFWSLDLYN